MQAVARMSSPDHSIQRQSQSSHPHFQQIPGDQVISMHPQAGIIASSQQKAGPIMTQPNGNILQPAQQHHAIPGGQPASQQFLHPAHHPQQIQIQQHGPPPPPPTFHQHHHHHHQGQAMPMQPLPSQAIPIQAQIPANYESHHHLNHLSTPPTHSTGSASPMMMPSQAATIAHPMNEFSHHQFAQAGTNAPQYMPSSAMVPQQNHFQPQQQQQQGLVHRGELRELNRGFPPQEAASDPFAMETIKTRGKIIQYQQPQQFNPQTNERDGSPFNRAQHHHHQHPAASNGNHFTAFQEQLQIHQQQQQQLQEIQSRQGRSMMHSPSAGAIGQYQTQSQQYHQRMRSPQNQENLHPFHQVNPHHHQQQQQQPQFRSGQPHQRSQQLAREPAQYSADQDRDKKLKMLIAENAQLISENEYYKQHLQSQSKEVQSSIQLQQEINELNLKVQQLSAQLQIQTDETSVWIAREREMSQRCRQLYDQAQQQQQQLPSGPSSTQANQEKQELLVKIYNLEGDARNQQRSIEELNACLQFYKDSLRTQQMSVPNSQQSHSRNSSLPSGQQQQSHQIYYQQSQPQQQQYDGFSTQGTGEQQQQQVYSSPRHRDELIQSIVQQSNIPASARSASASASATASTPTSQPSYVVSQNQGVNRQNYQQQPYQSSSHNSTNAGYASVDLKQEGTSKEVSQITSEIAEPISDWKQQYNLLTQKLNSLSSNTNQN